MTITVEASSPLKETAQALGYLVMSYSGLERTVSRLLGIMLKLSFPAGDAVLGHIDLPEVIAILKTYGYERKPNETWYKRLKEVLDHIDNELRRDRNRMIHDTWVSSDTGMIRINPKPRFQRAQSRQPPELKKDKITVPVSEIDALTAKVMKAAWDVSILAFEYQRDAQPYKWPG